MKEFIIIILIITLSSAEDKFTNEEYLLPTSIFPISYKLQLTPNLNDLTFTGIVNIHISTAVKTKIITMHSFELNILKINIEDLQSNKKLFIDNFWLSNDDRQFLFINTNTSLEIGKNYEIIIEYTGTLNSDLNGFFISTYKNEKNETRKLAVTQFEPSSARKAWPCWDEPKYRSQFNITIYHNKNYQVISNMQVLKYNETSTEFLPTISMPSYLVSFVISDFVSLRNSNHSIVYWHWSRPEYIKYIEYTNEVTPKLMSIMENYTGISYALNKLDQIAVPDFNSGAMENWGLTTYREDRILYSPTKSSTIAKRDLLIIVAHELAHQWFGNLVTMKWWSHLWLNEGFATYYSYYIVDKYQPSWRIMEEIPIQSMHTVFKGDAKISTNPLFMQAYSPNSIRNSFNPITYNKGSCIVRMMIGFMGEKNFQYGIKKYLKELSYENADKDDLWRYLSPSVKLPIDLKTIMDSWVIQSGYPLITVTRNYKDNSANILQYRYLDNGNTTSPEIYIVPLTIKYGTSSNIRSEWLNTSHKVIWNLPSRQKWILFNVLQIGYYRVNYDNQNWQLLINQLKKDKTQIHRVNRGQLINDAFTLAKTKHISYDIALDITNYLTNERDLIPWTAALMSFSYIHDRLIFYPKELRLLQIYLLSIINNTYNNYLQSYNINATDTDNKKRLRSLIIEWACKLGLKDCLEQSKKLFDNWKNTVNPDKNNPIHPDLKEIVYCTGIAHGGKNEYEFLLERYKNCKFPKDVSIILKSLACTKDKTLLNSLLDESIRENSIIRTLDSRGVLSAVCNNYWGIDTAFDFLLKNYNNCSKVYKGLGAVINSAFYEVAQKLNSKKHKNKFTTFRNANKDKLGAFLSTIDGAIQILNDNLNWNKEHKPSVIKYLNIKAINLNNEATRQCISLALLPLLIMLLIIMHFL